MKREFTCILCPRGCGIAVEVEDGKIGSITGNYCPKGREYVTQEVTAPMRGLTTSILVEGGELPLASVRLNRMIPKERIFDAMAEIRRIKKRAPVKEGEVVLADILGLGADLIVTKTVERRG
jgi:CxxC motif-containing protein